MREDCPDTTVVLASDETSPKEVLICEERLADLDWPGIELVVVDKVTEVLSMMLDVWIVDMDPVEITPMVVLEAPISDSLSEIVLL